MRVSSRTYAGSSLPEWAHVGTHQSRDEKHRKNGRDHRKRCQDRRIADFVDGRARGGAQRSVSHREVPFHVLGDDDGVVDHDSRHEDQREQRDAIECVTEELVDEQSESEGDRNRDHDDYRASPAHSEGYDDADRQDRKQQMRFQRADLLACGLAVVSGDFHRDVLRDHAAVEYLDLAFEGLAESRRVGARPLRNRNRHHGIQCLTRHTGERVGRDFFRAIDNVRYIRDLDERTIAYVEDNGLDVAGRPQEGSGCDSDDLIIFGEIARGDVDVGPAQPLRDDQRVDGVGRHTIGRQLDTYLSGVAADYCDVTDFGDALQFDTQLVRNGAKSRMVVVHA